MTNTVRIKQGGRAKGTPNKITTELKSMLKEVVNNELSNIEQRLNTLDNKQRIELVIKLLPYVVPKQETTNELPSNDSKSRRLIWKETI